MKKKTKKLLTKAGLAVAIETRDGLNADELGQLTPYFSISLERSCSHPVKEREFYLTDKEGTRYFINHDDITKIGIKWEF